MLTNINILIIILIMIITTIMIGFILFNPILGLVTLCFMIPLQDIVAQLSFPFFPILGALIVVGYLLTKVIHKEPLKIHSKEIELDYLIMLLLVFCIIVRNPESYWHAQDRLDPLGNAPIGAFTYIQLGVLYYLGSRLLRDYNLSWLTLGLLFGTTISALYGIKTIGFGGNLASSNLADTYRLQGAQGNANELATYALCGLALLPALQKLCGRKWQLVIVTLIGIFQIFIVFFTVSKTAFVGLACLMLLWLFFYKIEPIIKTNMILVICVFIIAALFIPKSFWLYNYDTIINGIFHKGGTMGQRYTLWSVAYLAFKESPIFGIGVGQFPLFALRYSAVGVGYGHVVHNAYLSLLAENGLTGIVLFLGFIMIAVYRFMAVLRRGTGNIRILAFSGLCSFAMMLLMCTTGSFQYNKLLWLLAGASVALSRDTIIHNWICKENLLEKSCHNICKPGLFRKN